MCATAAGWRLQLCNNTLHNGSLVGEPGAHSRLHAEPGPIFDNLRACWTDRRHPLRSLQCGGTSAPLNPQLERFNGKRGVRQGRKRMGCWTPRCLIEGVHQSQQDSGLRERLLTTEAAGITLSGKFSISDEEFSEEGLRFNSEGDSVDLDQLNGLFGKVGFPHRKRSKLRIALQNTLAMVWLLDTENDRLIAFARATGDAVFNATIWDVVVDPGWQKKGLGKAVIERLMAELLNRGIVNINLYAEPNVVSFYKPLGFVTDPSGISGMAFNKKKAAL
ncbi:Acyl-CoA N-acyltransferase domain-containing protein [Klebsormidium nitens]|uniref:Acyl-CoA N-acyltransferase domain-containing protein n=1 Tax=Klebsormidium nitens TaxID=105231 RepID=A0A0U9HQG0_KLENI|nr:Acyl-CoA N-acyltransferase domain-containing protein [Klebsormidium nitens]|eukprot:GAQ77635.1 Acyl-CoA N-acyltransferase domain-containing protein [Klebsormidium nitens]